MNRDVCIGGGMCALIAPEQFDQDEDDGKVVPRGTATTAAGQASLRRAVEACPSGAIRLAVVRVRRISGRRCHQVNPARPMDDVIESSW